MCQLAAYIGDRPIASLLLRAIEHQEGYVAGYATGLGVIDDGALRVEKDIGNFDIAEQIIRQAFGCRKAKKVLCKLFVFCFRMIF